MIVELLSRPAVLDLRNITNELGGVIDKWFRIGVQLGVNDAKLRQIGADYHSVDMCFAEVISYWLNGNTPVAVSWKSIIEALESQFVSENGLANQLREKEGLNLEGALLSTGTYVFIKLHHYWAELKQALHTSILFIRN